MTGREKCSIDSGLKNYTCIVIDEDTNTGEPKETKAHNKSEAEKIFKETYQGMKIAGIIQV